MLEPQALTKDAFARDGYVLLRSAIAPERCQDVVRFVGQSLDPLLGPVEFEADVGYPGSPPSRDAVGGATPRRLLHAYSRSQVLRDLATEVAVAKLLRQVMASETVHLSQCHHNCVMTKHPGYSSATLWHQDIRYWSFDRPELVSAWFALHPESRANGALRMIPGSHRFELDRGRLDRDLFLRPELPENRALIGQAIDVELDVGDVLLFHCRLFHAAGKNLTNAVKISPVFTYHTQGNQPIPGTRSSAYPSIPLMGA